MVISCSPASAAAGPPPAADAAAMASHRRLISTAGATSSSPCRRQRRLRVPACWHAGVHASTLLRERSARAPPDACPSSSSSSSGGGRRSAAAGAPHPHRLWSQQCCVQRQPAAQGAADQDVGGTGGRSVQHVHYIIDPSKKREGR